MNPIRLGLIHGGTAVHRPLPIYKIWKPAMRVSMFIVSVLFAVVMTGCAKHEEEKPTGAIPAYQQKALQQAKDVENVLNNAAEQQRKEIENQAAE
jgi:hypothetical protein